jgi:hypothetical protein
MSRLHFANSKANKFKTIHLSQNAIEDLRLWLRILAAAREGISMNLLTFRKPDTIYWSDACEFGLGGYSSQGHAWRWKIPIHLQHRAHINLLELMAETICIWIDILAGRAHPEECILCFGDSTTAMGWLHKSNFQKDDESNEVQNAKTKVARHLATLVIDHKIKLYSQWLHGLRNGLADALSRDDSNMSDDELTTFLSTNFPQQVPANFKIYPVPSEIEFFISSLLQNIPKRQRQHPSIRNSEKKLGTIGSNSSNPSQSPMTLSSCPSIDTTATNSWSSLPNHSDQTAWAIALSP